MNENFVLNVRPSIYCKLNEIGWGEEVDKLSVVDRFAFENIKAFKKAESLSTSGKCPELYCQC